MSTDNDHGYKRLSPFLRSAQNGKAIQFWCPGCDKQHQVIVQGEYAWSWNGDVILPTFQPSVLVQGMKTTKTVEGRWNGEWERDANGNGIKQRCHSFVKDGVMEFLSDCTHALAGQKVRISEWYTHEIDGLPGRPPKPDGTV